MSPCLHCAPHQLEASAPSSAPLPKSRSSACLQVYSKVCVILPVFDYPLADGKLPLEQRRNYTWVGNALTRVVREEGILTLWRGCGPTIGRAIVLNIAQLMSNDLAKDALCRQDVVQSLKQKNTFLQVLVAGYVAPVP